MTSGWTAVFHLSSAEGIQKQFHRFIFILKGKWKETMAGPTRCAVWSYSAAAVRAGIYGDGLATAASVMMMLKWSLSERDIHEHNI